MRLQRTHRFQDLLRRGEYASRRRLRPRMSQLVQAFVGTIFEPRREKHRRHPRASAGVLGLEQTSVDRHFNAGGGRAACTSALHVVVAERAAWWCDRRRRDGRRGEGALLRQLHIDAVGDGRQAVERGYAGVVAYGEVAAGDALQSLGQRIHAAFPDDPVAQVGGPILIGCRGLLSQYFEARRLDVAFCLSARPGRPWRSRGRSRRRSCGDRRVGDRGHARATCGRSPVGDRRGGIG